MPILVSERRRPSQVHPHRESIPSRTIRATPCSPSGDEFVDPGSRSSNASASGASCFPRRLLRSLAAVGSVPPASVPAPPVYRPLGGDGFDEVVDG